MELKKLSPTLGVPGFLFSVVSCSGPERTYTAIPAAFGAWQQEQILHSPFAKEKDCHPWVEFDPEPDKINFSYGDYSQDEKKGALVTFHPPQCDVGDGFLWLQYKVLLCSQNTRRLTSKTI